MTDIPSFPNECCPRRESCTCFEWLEETPLRACPTCHAWDPRGCRTCNGDGYVEDDGDGFWDDDLEPEAARNASPQTASQAQRYEP